jgi:hypothetical protein
MEEVEEGLEMNLDWVTPELCLGGSYPMEAAAHLAQRLGIRHVVDVRVERCDDEEVLHTHGITLLHLPTLDMCAVSQTMLRDGVAWVRERLARGEKVFIHCEYGIGRSALLALCVLVASGLAPLDALLLAKRRRPKVWPSLEQLEAFLLFAREWKRLHAPPWSLPGFEALTALAYSHLRKGDSSA